ncbi:LysR family transcriptional regulator [Pseudoalteromonas denitrificans]|jgi:DNA-binding transcriptional LysR family regulator|uniref:DNA-binding transcriptional regulator, LysR family n=1 Tax=Pseudoalteromonas denitrificans DSM 6059 TaxID=1123010 RepID=A0A1I1KAW4_9GAMM|nr:LysR family transcriptional regulator [Pseudoalteromonas denitrificans]SFC57625.1 DNA-binding transcriptional regulator, LysR family [Pseudoalteromonas denitrificans DSM 6059]
MEELKRIGIFTKVVQAKSFSEAARQLGVAKSAVSKQIRLLEDQIDVRLFNRSTRKLSLTEAGEIYYRHCEHIVNRAEFALDELHNYQNQPTGTLRISAPIPFGRTILIPVIKQLRELYPKLNVDLQLDDKIVNVVEQGIDLTLRVGALQDSNLIAKKLCDTPAVLIASPQYLVNYGLPNKPSALVNHQWLALSVQASPYAKTFFHKITGEKTSVSLQGNLSINSVESIIAAALNGLGVAMLAKVTIEELLKSGQLVSLLSDYQAAPVPIYAVYPHREYLPSKVKIFLKLLEKYCANASWTTLT